MYGENGFEKVRASPVHKKGQWQGFLVTFLDVSEQHSAV